jgi:hypothetical protein
VSYVDPEKVVRHLRAVAPKPPPPVGITAAALKAKTFKPIAWVIPDYIPDGLTLLASKPKLGKSWLMMSAAIAVAMGGYVLDQKCAQGDVLYAALEDNERRLKGRMAKLRQIGEWPTRLTFWTEMARVEDGGIDQLREWIDSVESPRLIIIDVFAKVKRQKGSQEGLYEADYAAAAPLKKLADETGVAIVLVHHVRKAPSDGDPLDMVSGSTGLTGAMDTILILSRGSDGVTLYARGRDIPEIDSALEFDKPSCRWSLLGDATEVRVSSERRAIIDALRADCDPLTSIVIADVTGRSRVSVRKLLGKMAVDGEVTKLKRGLWALPKSTPVTTVTRSQSERSGG